MNKLIIYCAILNDILLLEEIVSFFREKNEFKGANIVNLLKETDEIGNTALHVAAERGYVNFIEKLVFYGANLLAKNKYQMTP